MKCMIFIHELEGEVTVNPANSINGRRLEKKYWKVTTQRVLKLYKLLSLDW